MTEPMFARPFVLQRDHDVSGVSGTGTVADGVQFPDGSVAIRWRGQRPSTVVWASLADALHVHGHGGATRVVWSGQQLTPAAEQPQRVSIHVQSDPSYVADAIRDIRQHGLPPTRRR